MLNIAYGNIMEILWKYYGNINTKINLKLLKFPVDGNSNRFVLINSIY